MIWALIKFLFLPNFLLPFFQLDFRMKLQDIALSMPRKVVQWFQLESGAEHNNIQVRILSFLKLFFFFRKTKSRMESEHLLF